MVKRPNRRVVGYFFFAAALLLPLHLEASSPDTRAPAAPAPSSLSDLQPYIDLDDLSVLSGTASGQGKEGGDGMAGQRPAAAGPGRPEDPPPIEDEADPTGLEDLPLELYPLDFNAQDLASYPCLSLGSASRGRLVNGLKFPETPGFLIRGASNDTYGTPETVAALVDAVNRVHDLYPDTHDLVLGDISRKGGGKLWPHVSHQSGRDVDTGFYHLGMGQPKFMVSANASNFDVERTWALVEAMIQDGKVEYIFLDYSVQRLLYNYVRDELQAPDAFLERVFSYPRGYKVRGTIIQHAKGHRNHLHIRFWSPVAVAAGRAVQQGQPVANLELVATRSGSYISRDSIQNMEDELDGTAPLGTQVVKRWQNVTTYYSLRKGETLSHVAAKYHVEIAELKRWNKLGERSVLQPGQRIAIQQRKLVDVKVPVRAPEESETARAMALASAPTTARDALAALPAAGERPVAMVAPRAEKSEPAPAGAEKAEKKVATKVVSRVTWTSVREGDSLWAIAHRNDVSIEQLCKLNGISMRTKLQPGQKLKVRVWETRVPVEPSAPKKAKGTSSKLS